MNAIPLQLFNDRRSLKLKIVIAFLFLVTPVFLPSTFGNEIQKNNGDKTENSGVDLSSFKLQQNYPNPFNPTTQIKYSIPVESHVKLNVYNVLGNEVATLIDEDKPAGEYSVKFDASALSSGIYIYRLQTDYSTITKKMTMIK